MSFPTIFWLFIYPACFLAGYALIVALGVRLRRHTEFRKTGLLVLIFAWLPLGLSALVYLVLWLLEAGPAGTARLGTLLMELILPVGLPFAFGFSCYTLAQGALPRHSASVVAFTSVASIFNVIYFTFG